jgi:hypothetical protein
MPRRFKFIYTILIAKPEKIQIHNYHVQLQALVHVRLRIPYGYIEGIRTGIRSKCQVTIAIAKTTMNFVKYDMWYAKSKTPASFQRAREVRVNTLRLSYNHNEHCACDA